MRYLFPLETDKRYQFIIVKTRISQPVEDNEDGTATYVTEIVDPYEQYYLQTLLGKITEIKIVRKPVQMFKAMLARGWQGEL